MTENLTFGKAICAVMAEIRRLTKADKNAFDGYMFTSVDDFKDALRPLLAKNGLFVHVSEVAVEPLEVKNNKGQERHFVRYTFDVTLKFHTREEEPAERMSVILPLTGAQTSGAARSYIVKEWIKSRFLASAGDMQEEADLLEQAQGELRMAKNADSRKEWESLMKSYADALNARDSKTLIDWALDKKDVMAIMPRDWVAMFRVEMKRDLATLKGAEELDGMTDAELDEIAEREMA